MKRNGLALAALLAALAATSSPAAASVPASAATNCRQVDVNTGSFEGSAVNVRVSRVSCAYGRRLARRFITGPCRFDGFRVRRGRNGRVVMTMGRAQVAFLPAGGGRCSA